MWRVRQPDSELSFTNMGRSGFIHTPVCCPSRSEFLSGRYFHNIRVNASTTGGCMHVQTFTGVPPLNRSNPLSLPDKVNPHSFATYLVRDKGYTAAWLGKHVNSCPRFPPPGFDCPTCRWFTNGGGSDTEPGGFFPSATFNDFLGNRSSGDGPPNSCGGTAGAPPCSNNTRMGKDGGGTWWPWLDGGPTTNCTIDGKPQVCKVLEHGGYWTSVIGNKSIEWLHHVAGKHAAREPDGSLSTPFVLVVGPKVRPQLASGPTAVAQACALFFMSEAGGRCVRRRRTMRPPQRLGTRTAPGSTKSACKRHERRALVWIRLGSRGTTQ